MISSFFTRDPKVELTALLARQGWTVTHAETFETDPKIAKPTIPQSGAYHILHPRLMDNTARKLLRIVLQHPASRQDLLNVCSNEKRLDEIMSRFEEDGILVRDGETWRKSEACAHIHDIGATLEWVVAEWFRSRLLSPALHGVTIKEVPGGGDLDVVAVVNDLRVWVECKSVNRRSGVSEANLRWFLQRAQDFNPEVAILLVDSDSEIGRTMEMLNQICAEMDRELAKVSGGALPSEEPTFRARHKNELWWGEGNRFVTNVRQSIDTSLKAILRLYHSEIRHYLYLYGGPPQYARNYVTGEVVKTT